MPNVPPRIANSTRHTYSNGTHCQNRTRSPILVLKPQRTRAEVTSSHNSRVELVTTPQKGDFALFCAVFEGFQLWKCACHIKFLVPKFPLVLCAPKNPTCRAQSGTSLLPNGYTGHFSTSRAVKIPSVRRCLRGSRHDTCLDFEVCCSRAST